MQFNHLCFIMLGVCNDNLYRHSNNQSFILFPFNCAQYPNIVEYFWIFEYYSNKFSVCEYYSIFVLVNFERANNIRYLIWSKKIFVATTASKRSSQNLPTEMFHPNPETKQDQIAHELGYWEHPMCLQLSDSNICLPTLLLLNQFHLTL